MTQGTVTTCTEQPSKFGGNEKICDIAIDGQEGTVRVYAKSQTKAGKPIGYYPSIHQGARVELMPRQNGTGYFIQKVAGEANMTPAQPNPPRQERDEKAIKKAQAEYIETKAGQLYYAYQQIQDKFGNLLISEETARAFASTIIISLDQEGPK